MEDKEAEDIPVDRDGKGMMTVGVVFVVDVGVDCSIPSVLVVAWGVLMVVLVGRGVAGATTLLVAVLFVVVVVLVWEEEVVEALRVAMVGMIGLDEVAVVVMVGLLLVLVLLLPVLPLVLRLLLIEVT